MKKILLALFLVFSLNLKVNAASLCSYKEQTELNREAANVKATYEIKEINETDSEGPITFEVFEISILNITDNFYVQVRNDKTSEVKTFRKEDTTDGIAKFEWGDFDTLTNFTVQVYSTNATSCPNELYKTVYLTTPMFNPYSQRAICDEYSDLDVCQEFIMSSTNITEEKFLDEVSKHRDEVSEEENPEAPSQNEKNNSLNYLWYLGGGIVVGLGIVIAVKLIISRNRGIK